jgi:3-hydroxybutyryl-CoA dehydrogenase
MAIQDIAVIGAGTMGRGIAQLAASVNVNVVLIDVDDTAIRKGLAAIGSSLDRLVSKGKLTIVQKQTAFGLIKGTTDYNEIAESDIIVEAASEDQDVKVEIVKRIDAVRKGGSVVASNTSSVSITKLASGLSRPDQFIGMHFFNPVPAIVLVEIVRGLQTSDTTHDLIEAFALQLGKSPITVKNAPGFVVNRILLPMLNEAFFVLAEGEASATEIDQGMELGCNHPMGPLALADLIGLDVLVAVMEVMHDEFGDSKYRPCPLLRELVAAGYFGRKSGRGVFRY